MTRGVGWFALPSALARKRLAAAASCLAERRKSRGVRAPLGEQLLHVTVGKREAQVPADREQDHLRFKLAPLEQSGNRWDTEHPSILAARLSGQASKVATLPFHP